MNLRHKQLLKELKTMKHKLTIYSEISSEMGYATDVRAHVNVLLYELNETIHYLEHKNEDY